MVRENLYHQVYSHRQRPDVHSSTSLQLLVYIVPFFYQYSGEAELNGTDCVKWEHSFTIYDKVNTYTLYTTKKRPLKPLRYEMMGYDTLLSSYYDHYILDYHEFEAWKFSYDVFDIPTGTHAHVLSNPSLMSFLLSRSARTNSSIDVIQGPTTRIVRLHRESYF